MIQNFSESQTRRTFSFFEKNKNFKRNAHFVACRLFWRQGFKLNFNSCLRYKQVAIPEPFRANCLNQIEWMMIATCPLVAFGVLSGLFLLRKVWPFLGIKTDCQGLCPLDDDTYVRRPSHFVWSDIRQQVFKK